MILEALKRSREPVPGGASVPTLDTEHYQVVMAPATPSWVWGLAGVSAASLGFAAFMWFSSGHDTVATGVSSNVAPVGVSSQTAAGPVELTTKHRIDPASVSVQPQTLAASSSAPSALPASLTPRTAPATSPATSISGAVQTTEPSKAPPSASVAALYASRSIQADGGATGEATMAVAQGSSTAVTQGSSAAVVQGSSRAVAQDKPPELPQNNPAAPQVLPEASKPAPKASQRDIDVDEVLRRAQAAIGQERLSEHPAPLLESLSQQQKDRIPTVMYRQHDWASAGEASVVLNGQRLQVGDQHNGFRVQAILRDSVVLEWGGTTFRLRALNSWINL